MTRRLKAAGALACLALLCAGTAARAAAEPQMYWPPITDPPTGTYTPGKWVWAELLTRDVGRAADFYGKVFGWTFETYGPKDDAKTYTLVSSGGTPIAGMVFMNPARSHAEAGRTLGRPGLGDRRQARRGPRDQCGRQGADGRRARSAPAAMPRCSPIPEGGVFGVLHSATGDPEDYLGDENSFLWAELWADDAAAMAKFYSTIGGVRDRKRGRRRRGQGLSPRVRRLRARRHPAEAAAEYAHRVDSVRAREERRRDSGEGPGGRRSHRDRADAGARHARRAAGRSDRRAAGGRRMAAQVRGPAMKHITRRAALLALAASAIAGCASSGGAMATTITPPASPSASAIAAVTITPATATRAITRRRSSSCRRAARPPGERPPGGATTLPADVGGGGASTKPMPPSRPSTVVTARSEPTACPVPRRGRCRGPAAAENLQVHAHEQTARHRERRHIAGGIPCTGRRHDDIRRAGRRQPADRAVDRPLRRRAALGQGAESTC